jgi:hypothetical protein
MFSEGVDEKGEDVKMVRIRGLLIEPSSHSFVVEPPSHDYQLLPICTKRPGKSGQELHASLQMLIELVRSEEFTTVCLSPRQFGTPCLTGTRYPGPLSQDRQPEL